MIRWAAAWGAFALLFTGMAWGLEPPSLTGRVVDRAGVIESFKKEQIERLLEEHEPSTESPWYGLEGVVLHTDRGVLEAGHGKGTARSFFCGDGGAEDAH